MKIAKGDLTRFIEHSFIGAVESKQYLEALKYEAYMGMRKRDGWKIDNYYLDKLSADLIEKSGQFPLAMDLNDEIQDFLYRLSDWEYNEDDLMKYWNNKSTFVRNSFRLILNHHKPDYNEIFSVEMEKFLIDNKINVREDLVSLDRGVIFMEYEYSSVLENYFEMPEWGFLAELARVLAGITFCAGILKSPMLVGIGMPVDEFKGGVGNEGLNTKQWALFHYILQDKGILPRFNEIERDIQNVVKVYGMHWKTFQMKYNEVTKILRKDSGLKFRVNDIDKVEKLILNKHPDAYNRFKELVSGKY